MRCRRVAPIYARWSDGVEGGLRTRAQTIEITEADLEGFVPESGPIHLQRMVTGGDARVHVVGDDIVAQRLPPTRSTIAAAGLWTISRSSSCPSAFVIW